MIIDVTAQGLTPIMFDRFHNGILETITPKTTNKGVDKTPLESAVDKLYLYNDENGNPDPKRPYLPATYLLGAIVGAGRFIKIGKRQLSTRDETTVTTFLSLVGMDFPIRSKEGWRVDGRGVVNQVTKARVMAYRPIFDDWEFDFSFELDTNEARPSTARELVDKAGRFTGLGVMRPARKGAYGQYKVISWVERKE